MARELIIEEESGACRGWVHPHNGYYAGVQQHLQYTGRHASRPNSSRAATASYRSVWSMR
jgi:hypothetical protein